MLIDIAKIIIKDRIRQDYGNIDELANDISENGLINPPVVNRDYVLLAGERRLRACQMLGWRQIEVRMMDTRDVEHELNVEISENEVRKEFSKVERVDYMKRLLRIEQAKAKERQGERNDLPKNICQKSDECLRADNVVSSQFNVSRDTLRKEISIVDNKELLTPEDFADWDEGKLSTNKAYMKIKAELAAKDRRIAELEERKANEDLTKALAEKKMENAIITGKVKVIEKIPDDYEDLKRENESLKRDNLRQTNDYQKLSRSKEESDRKVEELQSAIGEDKRLGQVESSVMTFTNATNDYIRHYGGYVWVFSEFEKLREETRADFIKSLKNLDDFARQLITNLEGNVNG